MGGRSDTTTRTGVQVVRGWYEAWNRRDSAKMVELVHPDVVFHEPPEWPGAGEYHGIEAASEGLRRQHEAFRTYRMEVEDLIERGDLVLAGVREVFTGRASGVDVQRIFWHLWDIRDGRAARIDVFMERDQAVLELDRRAAG
jgi:ketosteroid isomerase-like protein